MGTLSRTALAIALASTLAPPATAVNVAAGGLGQVLLFPYYTANGNRQTIASVVNISNRAKAVRVRFLEGRNGKPVLDFNLYLSPFDVWTGVVGANGSTGAAFLSTSDTSCTVPRLALPQAFRPFEYTGANQDWLSAGTPASLATLLGAIERTREGHIEMIEMGALQFGFQPGQLADEATHNQAGVPANCQALVAAWTPPSGVWVGNAAENIDTPTGGLYGAGLVVDAANGSLLSYNAEAIEGFYINTADPGFLHRSPGSSRPNLSDADWGAQPIQARIQFGNGSSAAYLVPGRETVPSASQPYTLDALSLVLIKDAIYNEYATDPALGMLSEWVVTFPTKRDYVDVAADTGVRRPFTESFRDDGAACERVLVSYWNREERDSGSVPGAVDFNPPPPGGSPGVPSLCGQVNVIAFNQAFPQVDTPSALLGSTTRVGVRLQTVLGPVLHTGWMRLVFDDPFSSGVSNFIDNRVNDPQAGTDALVGLPAIGFWAMNYTRADATPGLLATYAGTVRHRFSNASTSVFP